MLVQAKQAFVSRIDNQTLAVRVGQIVEMPDGADWLQAGLVRLVAETIETAALDVNAGAEQATARRRRRTTL